MTAFSLHILPFVDALAADELTPEERQSSSPNTSLGGVPSTSSKHDNWFGSRSMTMPRTGDTADGAVSSNQQAVGMQHSDSNGWYLVPFTPADRFLSPLSVTFNL